MIAPLGVSYRGVVSIEGGIKMYDQTALDVAFDEPFGPVPCIMDFLSGPIGIRFGLNHAYGQKNWGS